MQKPSWRNPSRVYFLESEIYKGVEAVRHQSYYRKHKEQDEEDPLQDWPLGNLFAYIWRDKQETKDPFQFEI